MRTRNALSPVAAISLGGLLSSAFVPNIFSPQLKECSNGHSCEDIVLFHVERGVLIFFGNVYVV